MAQKLGRTYLLQVSAGDDSPNQELQFPLEIVPPITIEFDITRNILNAANSGSVRIYNLAKETRDQIHYNIFNQGGYKPVILRAGYGVLNPLKNPLALPIIFSGNISQAWSVRDGVNFITEIQSMDGGFVYSSAYSNIQISQPTTYQSIIELLIKDLAPTVTRGTIQTVPGTAPRGISISGPTLELLAELTGGAVFIDQGRVNILGNFQALKGALPLIDSSTGLLGTPVVEQNIVTFDMLFEPRLQAGQSIELKSETVNGNYKLTSVQHRGMISEAVCGDLVTTASMYGGAQGAGAIRVVPTAVASP